MKIRVINREDVRSALPMIKAIELMRRAYATYSKEPGGSPIRTRITVENSGTNLAIMPAYVSSLNSGLLVKVATYNHNNQNASLPTLHAIVQVFNPTNGEPLALIEGALLTAIRTGAGSGVASDVLARDDACVAAIIGCGVQAGYQLEAICTVRDIQKVYVYSQTKQKAEDFASIMAGHGPIPSSIFVADDPDQAIREADIICTATTSAIPVFDGRFIKTGSHINSIGSFQKSMRELDTETILKSRLVVDSKISALEEAGEITIPIAQGLINQDWIYAEIGEIINGVKQGRENRNQITIFKSVGLAMQDVFAASSILAEAEKLGIGTIIEL